MTDSLAMTLAARFRDDAQALRARATVLDSRSAQRGGGPDAAACRRMAEACDRVSALFAGAQHEDALADVGRSLDRLLSAERSGDARHVYEGAITRLRQAMDGGSARDDDDDEDDDDIDDDDEE
jgi:hypothetical protein